MAPRCQNQKCLRHYSRRDLPWTFTKLEGFFLDFLESEQDVPSRFALELRVDSRRFSRFALETLELAIFDRSTAGVIAKCRSSSVAPRLDNLTNNRQQTMTITALPAMTAGIIKPCQLSPAASLCAAAS
eukprot:GEMP01044542.1.p2 GENE.GEMP01044542.1~~GEMP01044542.1.p2  ORF type:complete len:129 (-),score=11.42 GEMP01044542.1:266-652(-)